MLTNGLFFDFDYVYKTFESEVIVVGNNCRLFSEGEDDKYIYFIRSGSVKILKNDWLISIAQANEFVGIHSTINDHNTYVYSCEVAEPSFVLKIKRQDFKNHILNNSDFSKRILKMLCRYNQLIDDKILAYVHCSPKFRIVREILEISLKSRDSGNVFLLEKDLSELTGVYQDEVKIILNQLIEKGVVEEIISKNQKWFRIRDYHVLNSILSEYEC